MSWLRRPRTWIVLGVVYLLYLNRRAPEALERGKQVFIEDPEKEPTGLLSTLL